MGVNDAQEMLEAAQEECIRLEKELAELTTSYGSGSEHRTYLIGRLRGEKHRRENAESERDAALAVIGQLRAVVDNERIPDEVHGDDWIRAEHFQPILAQSLASALAKVKADAWDEGASAWTDDRFDGTGEGIHNPYREKEGDRG